MTAFTQKLVPVAVDADSVLVLTQLEDPHDQSCDRHTVRPSKNRLMQAVCSKDHAEYSG